MKNLGTRCRSPSRSLYLDVGDFFRQESWRQESNLQHPVHKTGDLPVDLRQQVVAGHGVEPCSPGYEPRGRTAPPAKTGRARKTSPGPVGFDWSGREDLNLQPTLYLGCSDLELLPGGSFYLS